MTMIAPADRVLLRQLPAEKVTAFGLELPEVARERPLRAIVVAVGAGTPHPQNPEESIPLGLHEHPGPGERGDGFLYALAEGDEVVIPKYGGTEIEAEEGDVIISILASEILAVVG